MSKDLSTFKDTFSIMRYVSSEYDCEIKEKSISFYHNTKTHQYDVVVDGSVEMKITRAKGKAVIEFLKLLGVDVPE